MRLTRAAGCIAVFITGVAVAQSAATPAAPALRLIVPVPPGGTSDVVARILAIRLSTTTRRPVFVDNRPGATGRIAVDALLAANASDNVLVAPIAVPVIGPLVFGESRYDVSGLAPVSRLATFDYAFAVAATSEWHSFAEFVAWARTHPGGASFGAAGNGGIPHFVGMQIARVAGYATQFVPYTGAARLEADLLGRHVVSAVSATSDVLALQRAGKIRILATTGRTRALGDVPTFRELGLIEVDAVGWTALFASARLPAREIDALAARVKEALDDPEARRALIAAGVAPSPTTPQELATIIAADIAHWRPIIRASGFVADTP